MIVCLRAVVGCVLLAVRVMFAGACSSFAVRRLLFVVCWLLCWCLWVVCCCGYCGLLIVVCRLSLFVVR